MVQDIGLGLCGLSDWTTFKCSRCIHNSSPSVWLSFVCYLNKCWLNVNSNSGIHLVKIWSKYNICIKGTNCIWKWHLQKKAAILLRPVCYRKSNCCQKILYLKKRIQRYDINIVYDKYDNQIYLHLVIPPQQSQHNIPIASDLYTALQSSGDFYVGAAMRVAQIFYRHCNCHGQIVRTKKRRLSYINFTNVSFTEFSFIVVQWWHHKLGHYWSK